MRFITKASAALAVGLALCASSASAATVTVQAGAGHPFLTFLVGTWQSLFTGADSSWYNISDGRSIELAVPNVGTTVSKGWITPIPLAVTNVTWNVIARADLPGGVASDFTNRVCAFNSAGAFTSCGATVNRDQTSSVLVPTDGTANSQSTIVSKCIAGGFCGVASRFHQIKASSS